jgi:hypothetical protein
MTANVQAISIIISKLSKSMSIIKLTNIIYIEQKSKRDTTTIKSLTYIPWAKYLFEMFLETTVPYIHGLPILNYES